MYYRLGQEHQSELTSKQGVTIAVGILCLVGWIFFRTLHPVKLFRRM